jgi:hypothetical protein
MDGAPDPGGLVENTLKAREMELQLGGSIRLGLQSIGHG